MSENHRYNFDFIVIGSGLAGLYSALQLARNGTVAVITKGNVDDCNTRYAQGGIACVLDAADTFDEHVRDTLAAGDHLCNEAAVRKIVEAGPSKVRKLIELGAHFTTRGELGEVKNQDDFDLGKEGGHTKRRIIHAGDITGAEIERILVEEARSNPNISIFENHIAIDLITSWRMGWIGDDMCLGVYALDSDNNVVKTFCSLATVVATGGAGKVYRYSSNSQIACGDGIAMCYRAHAKIANMEFFQFHPTILYHPQVNSFLISEAVRGEGAVLKKQLPSGKYVEFMDSYHPMKSLAPRDIVARAIDNELKRSGQRCVYLDIRHHSEEVLRRRFPNIFEKCMSVGINMAKDLIPVVPAAHYTCGGVKTDTNGFTGINGLYAVGEVACTGLHGANRLASNSLLEALVVSEFAADDIAAKLDELKKRSSQNMIPDWQAGKATNSDEQVVITHNWEEIRHFMWDYVGIVRTDKRLERAKQRISLILREIDKYYWDFFVSKDLLELRALASVAELIIDSALSRKESRGLHYNSDHPERNTALDCVDTVIQKPSSR